MRSLTLLIVCFSLLSSCSEITPRHGRKLDSHNFDVVVYGGTSAGVAAAVQAARSGLSVALIEPSNRLGGLSSGGLGATDIGNKAAIGGFAREFYQRVAKHYSQPEVWRFEAREAYLKASSRADNSDTMWTFEPSVAKSVFDAFLAEHKIDVLMLERLDRSRGIRMEDEWIRALRLESGREIRGRMFIDASYEGDLLALAGATYHIGREANATYGETLNGVQTERAVHHQFSHAVDPYRIPKQPESGLLPGVQTGPGKEGAGDSRVQAYCFRMCLTDAPGNRIPIEKPADYDPLRYEILLRYYDAGFAKIPWHRIDMPNRKTDINNNHGFSTDNIGLNYDYPEGSYAEREAIVAEHRSYQLGLLWCLANNPRVPESVRKEVQRWGLPRDEYEDTGHWPGQLYIREARRLVGELVMTQAHCEGVELADRSIGLAAYTMDSHNVQRYVRDGRLYNEGDVQVGGFDPYPIGYGAIVPKRKECANLLVPVCLSASHIAFGSIRMEPVFMVLGQSAALAASLAIGDSVAVQDVDYPKLRERLLQVGQTLEWSAPKRVGVIDRASVSGIVFDDSTATREGAWFHSTSNTPFFHKGYLHDGNQGKGSKRLSWKRSVPESGNYSLRVLFSAHPNRSRSVTVEASTQSTHQTFQFSQREVPQHGPWLELGSMVLQRDETLEIVISTTDTDGYVVVDALQLQRVD